MIAVINTDSDSSYAKTLTDYDIQYLLLPNTVPLVQAINTTWPCCINRYENNELSLYEFRYPIANTPVQPDEITISTNFRIGDFAILKGYTLNEQANSLFVTLYWQPLQQTPIPYTVFVHLLGDVNPVTQTPLWTQDDHPPRLGQIPTTTWKTGDLIRDMYQLDLTDLKNGRYSINLDMYDSTNAARVSISDETGKVIGDSLLLTWISLPSSS